MSQTKYQEAMNQGHTSAWDQKWEEAAEQYRLALAEEPDDPRALISMGLAMFELGRYENAIEYYSAAAESNPEDPLPYEKIAQIAELIGKDANIPKASLRAAELYQNQGETERAIENLARVTRADAGNLAAHSRLAVIYERQGRKGQAVTEYLVIAGLLQRKGQFDYAVKAIERAMAISPESNEARRTLDLLNEGKLIPKPARARVDTSRYREPPDGISEPTQIQTPIPNQIDPIKYALQKALEELASLIFEPYESKPPESPRETPRGLQTFVRDTSRSLFSRKPGQGKMLDHLRSALDYHGQGMEGQAATELELALEAGLNHPAVSYSLGYFHAQEDKQESAIPYLKDSAETKDYGLGSHLLLGQVLRKIGREDEAAIAYLKALQIADGLVVPPEKAEDLKQLYEPLIDAENQQTEAESKARICDTVSDLLIHPDWRERLLQARKDFQIDAKDGPAIPLGEVISQTTGGYIIESIMKIHQLARQGYMRSAMEESYFALHNAPTYLPLHIYMGELLLMQDRLPDAIAKLNTVALTYSSRGESDRAISILRRVIRTAPMNLTGRQNLIDILESLDKSEEVVHEYVELADVYYNLADLDQALRAYSKALNIAQMDGNLEDLIVEILHRMADINLQSLDWRQALIAYDHIRTINPGDVKARENLVELNLRLSELKSAKTELQAYLRTLGSQERIQNAAVFLERLSSENPNQLFLRRGLIILYKQLERNEDAIRLLDFVGETLLQSGDRQGAVEVIEEILALNPPNRDDYQSLLIQLKG
jgi:tetratricopeptide (TPR) repeat protein